MADNLEDSVAWILGERVETMDSGMCQTLCHSLVRLEYMLYTSRAKQSESRCTLALLTHIDITRP